MNEIITAILNNGNYNTDAIEWTLDTQNYYRLSVYVGRGGDDYSTYTLSGEMGGKWFNLSFWFDENGNDSLFSSYFSQKGALTRFSPTTKTVKITVENFRLGQLVATYYPCIKWQYFAFNFTVAELKGMLKNKK